MFGINYFGIVDYIAVGGTLFFSLGIGLYYAFIGKQTQEEMLVGGRSMRVLPISISMLVTYLSAVTILGYPAEVYSHGIQIFLMTMIGIISIPLSSFIFVKVFYEMKLTSVYEYLELRFDSIAVRWLGSFTFILQVTLINGVILYAPAIALEAIVGLPVWLSIVGIGCIGTAYTSVGGIKAVVVTDCFQFIMIAIGLVSIMTKGFIAAGGIQRSFEIAYDKGRLQLFDFTLDPFQRHNFWNFLFGYGFTMISLYGTHQPQVQRYCSLPSLQYAIRAMLFTIPFKIFTMSLVIMTGISVFAKYAGCCPILLGKIKRADSIIPHFVIEELSFIPGMMGIFVSCIFSAVLSSISSTLNSLAAVTWEDGLKHMNVMRQMSPKGQANLIRFIAVAYGIISMGVAFGVQNLGAIFQLVMTAVGATSGPLGGIFICGLFMPIINKYGAIFGMLSGLTSMIFMALQAHFLKKTHNFHPNLPTSLDDCPGGTDFEKAISFNATIPAELEWPQKMYTLSYILYPIIGALITTFVGLLVSVLTGGLNNSKTISKKYLHPSIHRYFGKDEEPAKFHGKDYMRVNSSIRSQSDYYTKAEPSPYDRYKYEYSDGGKQ